MLERLEYRGPAVLLEAVRAGAGGPMRFGTMLDLGCGSGLGGAAFRPCVDWLVGVDLSPAMIEVARAKGLYDRLSVGEIGAFLREEAANHAAFQLVLAADVFVYCADLAPVAVATAAILAPGGLFAFTVESHDGAGVRLTETLRYAHSADHVRAALESAGLAVLALRPAATRTEKGVPVSGLVAVARGNPAGRRSP